MLKVIIADDETHICKLIQALVDWEELSMKVEGVAGNGLEALDMIEQFQPDILITDIRMPGCNGLELIEKARSKRPGLEIIIISGYAHFEYAQTAMKYGVCEYLLKPINQSELTETLIRLQKKCLEQQSRQDEEEQSHKNSQMDLNRLRRGLLLDLLEKKDIALTAETVMQRYHFVIKTGELQIYILKIDAPLDEVDENTKKIIFEKAEQIFNKELAESCIDQMFYCEDYTAYGLIHYQEQNRSLIRKQLRNSLNQLEEQRKLFGMFHFSLALGKNVSDVNRLSESLVDAGQVILERMTEGTGHMLEGVPISSVIEKQMILEHYTSVSNKAIEAMDEDLLKEAADSLEASCLAVVEVRGRELYEIAATAGESFISRMHIGEMKQVVDAYTVSCNQCFEEKKLFDTLRLLQRELLHKKMELLEGESIRPVRLAKQYVSRHFAEPVTMEEVCESIGFSTSYFSALFKKETGEGFLKYLTRVRMDEAKTLLRETNMPVAEICEKVGYLDRKHFTQTFNKAVGLNPAEYRKLYS